MMEPNSREQAEAQVVSFLRSDHRFLLLSGTHQQQKHQLVLESVLNNCPRGSTILFRTSDRTRVKDFLLPAVSLETKPRAGVALDLPTGHVLFVDSMNPRSWHPSPSPIDVAIIYWISSLGSRNGPKCVDDVVARNAQKVFLVTWTDNTDVGWARAYEPVRVVYDAKSDRPDVHADVIECCVTAMLGPQLRALAYSRNIPEQELVRAVSCASSYVVSR